MSAYPKHYLADVPQEIRLRVLDLCIRRHWHNALDLLHQNGFTQYEWFELAWFHDHAPTNLPHVDCGGATPLSTPGRHPETRIEQPVLSEQPALTVGRSLPTEPLETSSTQEPASEPQILTPEPNLNAATVKVCKPRGKIARLPKHVRTNLNTMFADGCAYMDIIRYLNSQGFPGFNKVNLNAWKKTGFQNWFAEGEVTSSETVQPVLEADGNR